jgi:hypothetical protein
VVPCFNPTIAQSSPDSSSRATTAGIGLFQAPMAGLKQGTTYYARAYATNALGTGYGKSVSFVTPSSGGRELAFWSFGSTGPGFTTAPLYHNLPTQPVLSLSGGVLQPGGLAGLATQTESASVSRGAAAAWLDVNVAGSSATIDLRFDGTGFQEFTLKFDYMAEDAGSFIALEYSTNGGTTYLLAGSPVLTTSKIDDDYNWLTATLSLAALSALNNHPDIRIRLRADASGGADGEWRVDNLMLIGKTFCVTPANPPDAITGPTNACVRATLNYGAFAPAGVSYYWQDSPSGTSTSSNALNALVTTNTGNYYVRAKTNVGDCWSAGVAGPLNLVVSPGSEIIQQPQSRNVTTPAGTSFSVATVGGSPLFQWQTNVGGTWINLTNSGIYSGVNTATLVLSSTNTALNNSVFRCVISAFAGCAAIETNVAILTTSIPACVNEGFSGGVTPPAGWTYSGIATFNTAGNFGSASPSLQFNNTDDRITTPVQTGAATSLRFWYKGVGTDPFCRLLIEGWNGTGWVVVDDIAPLPDPGVVRVYNASSSPVLPAGLLQFRFTYTKSGLGNLAFDDLVVICDLPTCAPTPVISSFSPSSGPIGTRVMLKGTGFSTATAVKFGAIVSPAIEIINDTILLAEVPEITAPQRITIITGAANCEGNSASLFQPILSTNCSDGGVAADLMITEVYHRLNGTSTVGGYIEIFNGTPGTINLSGYNLRIVEADSRVTTISLGSGNLNSGGVFLVRFGAASAATCSGAVPSLIFANTRFLGDDQIFLLKAGDVLDYVPNPNHPDAGGTGGNLYGWSQRRAPTTDQPSAVYKPAEWLISQVENCSHVGDAPFTVGSSNIVLLSQPNDADCNSLFFSVTDLSTGPGINTYQWKYLAPGENNWLNANTIPGVTVTNANTPALSVSGPIVRLLGYQFYCEINRAGCRVPSRAVRYQYETRPFYRSVTSGPWTDPTTWEMSFDEAAWVPSPCQYPIDVNSTKIVITQNHEITVSDPGLVSDQLVIEEGGRLRVADGIVLRVNDSVPGPDLLINGTLELGNSASLPLLLSGGAHWQMGNQGVLVQTGSSSLNALVSQYEGGIAAIPATASWIYRFNGSVAPAVVDTTMVYPNLVFESVAGPHDFSTASEILKGGASTPIVVKGDVRIGNSTGNPVSVFNNNIHPTPLLVLGNLVVSDDCLLSNSSITGTSNGLNQGFGTGFEVRGDVLLNSTGKLHLRHRAVDASSGRLHLSGTTPQVLVGADPNAVATSYLTIDNPAGVTSQAFVGIDSLLRFSSGLLHTHASRRLLLGTHATHQGSGSTRYINGPVSKQFASLQRFDFPVGKQAGPGFRPFGFASSVAAPGEFEGEYYPASPPSTGFEFFQNTLLGIVNTEYWMLDRKAGATEGRVILNYTNPGANNWRMADGTPISPCTDCNVAVVKQSMVGPNGLWNFPDLTDSGNFAGATNPPEFRSYLETGEIISKNISNFSPFTIGFAFNTVLGVLPVHLLHFNAVWQGSNAQLSWSIDSDADLKTFIVLHSRDGRRFDSLATIPPAGRQFGFVHRSPGPGRHYYRLMLVEKNGTTKLSPIKQLQSAAEFGWQVKLLQNPVLSNLTAALWLPKAQFVEGVVTDMSGRQLARIKQHLPAGNGNWTVQVSHLPAGVYQLTLQTADGRRQTLAWVKQ